MKRKLVIIVAALLLFGLAAGAYAIKLNRDSSKTTASCCQMDCCKDGHCDMAAMHHEQNESAEHTEGCCCCAGNDNCPMKNKQATDQPSEKPADMSKVDAAGNGHDCCNGCSCCDKKS